MKQVHALQDEIKIEQPGGPGKFEIPNWDHESQGKIRAALLQLGNYVTDTRRAFGAKGEVDPVQRLISAATTWGGNPPKDAIYLNYTPGKNDGKTVYKLHLDKVPVDGFWSISLYNAKGYFEKNPLDSYSLNNITAQERRRFGRRPVRRLRRQDSQLPRDDARLELHGPAVSPACRNSRWHLEISRSSADELGPLLARSRHEAVQFGEITLPG